MTEKEEMPKEAYQDVAIEGGHVVQLVKDPSKLKGRLAKKFADDSSYESSFVVDTKVSQFVKPLKPHNQWKS